MLSAAAAASLVPFTEDAMPFHQFNGADVCVQLTPPLPDVKIKPREKEEVVTAASDLPSPEEATELQLPDTMVFVQL
jgi:hypothetical protein